ncbi:MAG TPA: YceI family protein [Lysobacter sp.]
MPARPAPARKPPACFRALWLAVSAVCLVPAAHAFEPQTYAIDPVHTRVLFAIDHAGFSKAMGTVSGSTGTLVFDRDDWSSARLDVRVPLERLDMGDAKWNDAVRAGNLLDTKRHPDAHFVSTKVEPVDADHAKVCGELTLRGVTKPVCMDVTFNALKRHPLPPFHRTAGFSATATLSRAEFGMSAWPTVIGDGVELRIEAEAQRARGDAQDASIPVEPDASAEPSTPEPEPQNPPEPTP